MIISHTPPKNPEKSGETGQTGQTGRTGQQQQPPAATVAGWQQRVAAGDGGW